MEKRKPIVSKNGDLYEHLLNSLQDKKEYYMINPVQTSILQRDGNERYVIIEPALTN